MLRGPWVPDSTEQIKELRQGQGSRKAKRGEEGGGRQSGASRLGQSMEGVVGHLKGLNLEPEATEGLKYNKVPEKSCSEEACCSLFNSVFSYLFHVTPINIPGPHGEMLL